jgi:hypothetical protein
MMSKMLGMVSLNPLESCSHSNPNSKNVFSRSLGEGGRDEWKLKRGCFFRVTREMNCWTEMSIYRMISKRSRWCSGHSSSESRHSLGTSEGFKQLLEKLIVRSSDTWSEPPITTSNSE